MDAEFDGIATALSTALYKDGQQAATANQPMGGFAHTNVGNGTARNMYASVGQVQDEGAKYATSGGSSNAYTLTLSPAITAYAAGQRFAFLANHANDGAATLNVSGLGAKAIQKRGAALASGDIPEDSIVEVRYDGTQFQMVSPAIQSPTTTRGDIIKRGASADERLAIGAANTVLVSDGTDPSWSTVGLANIAQAAKLESFVVRVVPAGVALAATENAIGFPMPYNFTVTEVFARLDTAQTSGNVVTIDVKDNGTTILSTKITIDNGEASSLTAATAPVISDTAIAKGSMVHFDIDQIGDGTAKGLSVVMVGYQS